MPDGVASSGGAFHRSGPLEQSSSGQVLAATLALTVLSVFALSRFNDLVELYFDRLSGQTAWVLMLPLLVATGAALALHRVRYADFLPVLSICLRSSALGLLVLLVLEPVDFTLANAEAAGALQYVQVGYWFAVLMAALSVFRPSAVPAVAIYLASTRHLAEPISTLDLSMLDVRYMLDMALYLCVMGIALVRFAPADSTYFGSARRQEEVVFVAIGLHLGNYFWSALAKLSLGPEWWTWIFDNSTYNVLLFSLQSGTLPIGAWPPLVSAAFDVQRALVVPLNLAVLGFQLFAVICVLRRSWLKVATYFYDVFHLGIWILGGLFFWPWIWNNVTVLLATKRLPGPISPSAKAACCLTILLGAPFWPFHQSAFLGWFDVADARQIYFEAVTPNETAKVPASFFLSHSYAVSHGYMDTVPHVGQYPHLRWGSSSRSHERLLTSGACPPTVAALDPDEAETAAEKANRLDRVERFVRAHHAKMLERQAALGQGSFYWRLHHHPSNPLLFDAFNRLDLREITGYRLVVESLCHSLEQGRPAGKVVGRLVEDIDV